MKLRSLYILMIILPFSASAQNVGIGIDAPQAKLHINGNFKLQTDKYKTLKISLCKPHQLKPEDKVKLIVADGMQEQINELRNIVQKKNK